MSAHDQADDPPSALYASMIPIMDPNVPEIIRKVPMKITKEAQTTPIRQPIVGFSRPLRQLSYSHMQPIGWKQSSVPKRAPQRDTMPLKTGMALARM